MVRSFCRSGSLPVFHCDDGEGEVSVFQKPVASGCPALGPGRCQISIQHLWKCSRPFESPSAVAKPAGHFIHELMRVSETTWKPNI